MPATVTHFSISDAQRRADAVNVSPERGYMVRWNDGHTYNFLFNPMEIEHAIKVNWTRTSIPGRGAPITQYVSTEAMPITFTLWIDTLARETLGPVDIATAMRFFSSLAFPRKSADMKGASPPSALFVWPAFYKLGIVLDSAAFKLIRMAKNGPPTLLEIKLDLKTISDVQIFSEDVSDDGSTNYPRMPPPGPAPGGTPL